MECSDGQSIIYRKYTTADKDAVMTAMEYFLRTGKLWNGIPWMKSWQEWEDENEQGQKLIGKPGGRKKAFQKVDMEKVMISMGISKMEVRDRVTNGELPA